MSHIATRYLGLELKSPVILSSSGLSATTHQIRQAEQAGAGAVVLKSIFEEQILFEVDRLEGYTDYPEAADYLRRYVTENSLAQYLKLIADTKAGCSLPVIASINCRHAGRWVEFAREIEQAGADALELNIFLLPTDKETSSDGIERRYLDIVAQVRQAVSIPLSVKLGAAFTNPLSIVREIYNRQVQGVVLFNRFYPADIDIEKMTVRAGNILSHPSELSNVIRWTALVKGTIPEIDVAATTGIYTGEDVVKAMLAGASAVEIASVVYEHGFGVFGEMNRFIAGWMERHGYAGCGEFVGQLDAASIPDPLLYERTQFIKYFSNHG